MEDPLVVIMPEVVYTDVSVIPEQDKEGIELTISSLQGEISSLRSKQKSLDGRRREALNKILDIKGSIRVFCRVLSSPSKHRRNTQSPVSTEDEKITVKLAGGTRKAFGIDRAFSQEAVQGENLAEDVFQEVEPILKSAFDGHNVCIFAYGQTGTGKTFTMEGSNDQPGVVLRSIEELFHRASQDKSASFTFSICMLEIYMGSIRDLLTLKHSSSRSLQSPHKSGLNVLSSSNGSVEIEGLTDVSVSDFKKAYRWYSRGKRARATSWTNVNDASSRSHCLTRITIRRPGNDEAISKLWMVDLGGSERLLKTGATGQTLEEGKAINLSLSALGDVIASLKKKRSHIPYRNSKLTQVLSDSLGDGSKVLMIVHISPNEEDVGETVCSLSFANRVRAIEHNREISEELKNQKKKLIAELDQNIKDAEVELQKVRNQIEIAENLIQEKTQLYPLAYQLLDSPRSPLIITGNEEISESPQTADRTSNKTRNVTTPRFMASTVASRQRLSANEASIGRTRPFRMGTINPLDLIGSQSLSHSEPYMKANPVRLKSKLVVCETNSPTCRSMKQKVSTSHPTLRVTLQHRRRMSDLT